MYLAAGRRGDAPTRRPVTDNGYLVAAGPSDWFERFFARATWLLDHRDERQLFGLVVFGLTLSAFLAPPFSGLDTLPSLGVVVIGLGLLLRDAALAAAGAVIGAVGVALVIALGTLVVKAVGSAF